MKIKPVIAYVPGTSVEGQRVGMIKKQTNRTVPGGSVLPHVGKSTCRESIWRHEKVRS